MKVTERLEQHAVVFANGHRANFAICRTPFAKSKERTRAPARFSVLKGPSRRQTVRTKHHTQVTISRKVDTSHWRVKRKSIKTGK
jgi:hypothetical protein